MKLTATIVFQKNWQAINKICETCNGTGYENELSCSHCGDGISKEKGAGKQYKYIINEGSSRSSKTYSLIDCFDFYCRSNTGKRLTVWRNTKTDCVKTVLNDILKHLKKTGRFYNSIIHNKTNQILTYQTGSTFEIHGTDDENTVHGLTQDAAWLNEPYDISRDVFNQIDQRTSDFIFIDWNPKEAHWIDDIKKSNRSIVIKSTFKDNPFCPVEQKLKILSYQTVNQSYVVENKLIHVNDAKKYDTTENASNFESKHLKELIRCLDNEKNNSASDYMWSVYGLGEKAEKPNRIFNWTEISLQDFHDIKEKSYIGVDWGVVDPFGIIEVKYYDGALYLNELNYDSENIINSKLNSTERAQIGDSEDGLVAWLFKKLQIPYDKIVVCDSNRPSKIISLRRAGWEYAISCGNKEKVTEGVNNLTSIKVYYTSNSKNIKYEQENYSRSVDKFGAVQEDPEDKDNHTIDPTRYVYTYLRREGIVNII